MTLEELVLECLIARNAFLRAPLEKLVQQVGGLSALFVGESPILGQNALEILFGDVVEPVHELDCVSCHLGAHRHKLFFGGKSQNCHLLYQLASLGLSWEERPQS